MSVVLNPAWVDAPYFGVHNRVRWSGEGAARKIIEQVVKYPKDCFENMWRMQRAEFYGPGRPSMTEGVSLHEDLIVTEDRFDQQGDLIPKYIVENTQPPTSMNPEQPKIKIGDVVRLKSGGPDMTVKSFVDSRCPTSMSSEPDNKFLHCIYFLSDHNSVDGLDAPPEALELVNP